MRRAIVGLVLAVSATSAVPAHAAPVTGDQPATGTAVAVITHDPREDEASLPDSTRAALDIAMDRALANPAELSVPYAEFDTVVAPVKTTAAQPAVDVASGPMTVAASPLGLGSDDGSIPDDGVTEKPAAQANAFSAHQAGPTMMVRPHVPKVRYGLADLDQVQQEVLQTALPGGDELRTAYVDAPNNRVLVKASEVTQELREALAARYGADRVALYLVPGLAEPVLKDNRQDDSSPYYGGAYFDYCSTAFGWVHEGKSYMLTAGHCTSLNKPASNHNGTMGTVTADNWNNNTGSVKWNGQSYYSGDVSTIKMSSGKASSHRVYRGGPNSGQSRAVTDKWRNRSGNGDRYCVSGQKTGEMCGWKVISTYVTVRYSGNRLLRNATEGHRDGVCTRGGDSGAPIYTIRGDGGVAAKGVLSGGSSNTSGSCWDYFTDTSLAEKALAGVLRVQAPR
ncbi:hypothetical protein UK23_01085 [Lentzea aerocolonigenes]|uniref:Serine protease n=1 Tax=Lentzea aerocolonigenes TaxID=68170 RepID=A0A0F0HCL9_LENAE|nr:hypothetical protein [Lentzea aerocolonigenes]KJK53285.1 hypothetical protein UK23_01085 [Lentzea aerocolonigenes]